MVILSEELTLHDRSTADEHENHEGEEKDTPATGADHITHIAPITRITPIAHIDHQPTPYEAAQRIVARHDVHITRVWRMRSPSTEPLEDSSSANFHAGYAGTPPAGAMPVEGLRMSQTFPHEPVMADEVVGLFASVPSGLIVDGTLGGAGHAKALLQAYPDMELLGIDRDPFAVESAAKALRPYASRATVRHARFDSLTTVVRQHLEHVYGGMATGLSGVFLDLGVSSPQLDIADRGFSYRNNAPLDMRMDPSSDRTGADVVNEYDEDALVALFIENGEGRFARRIAKAIIAARPIITTGQLADVVRTAIPAATRRTGGHPARRIFQAIRIAVNEELDQLDHVLGDALRLLRPGGRCVVISYHSGEDRLVKAAFHDAVTGGCTCPPGLPCVCGAVIEYRLVHRGSMRPSPAEVQRNRRSEAARLRVIERIGPTDVSEVA